ncbi:hypothetical protein, partial [Asanoa sp. NPDC050611]|uniref:sugar phosphate isomerase/epimerase family protein n=1 Tax=Asanoa sp. NPDC050611 TaxID=3157098 RepID=UPI0033D24A11
MTDVGVQLYSVREPLVAGADAVLGRLAAIGYRLVEPTFGLLGGDPPGFRRLLGTHRLTACALHAPILGPLRDEIAAAALAIGARTVVVPSIPAAEFATAAGVARSAERLAEAATWLAGRGLALAYHNHHWELAHRPAGRPALELLAALLPPSVALEVDVYWATVGGADVPALLHQFGQQGAVGRGRRAGHGRGGPAVDRRRVRRRRHR